MTTRLQRSVPLLAVVLLPLLAACTDGDSPVDAQAAPRTAAAPALASTVAAPAAAPTTTAVGDIATRIGVACPADANALCDSGDYDVERHAGCGAEGFFGGVSAPGGALLVDKVPPGDTRRVATLAKGQLVCIEAIARAGQQPAWYYVTQYTPDAVAACRDNALFKTYGARDATWVAPGHEAACRASGIGEVGPGCASGWTDATHIEAFSNGM